MSAIGSSERREATRYERQLPLVLYDDGKELLDEGPVLQNVSAKGLGFETVARLEPGEKFRFQLELPGGRKVAGTARTRWVQPNITGLAYQTGAEIESLGWGQMGRLKAILQPYGEVGTSGLGAFFDMALTGGCCVVGLLILNESFQKSSVSSLSGYFMQAMEVAPQMIVVGAALLGIVFLLRR